MTVLENLPSLWPWTLLALFALGYLFLFSLEPTVEPREPPLVRQRLPVVGNIMGMYLYGPGYYRKTSLRTKSPMHTLGVLGKKLYIAGAPELVTAVSRVAKTVSFTPFVSEIGIRVTGCDDATRDIIELNLTGPNKKTGYVAQIHDQTVAVLAPGLDLDQITRDMLAECSKALKARDNTSEATAMPLYAFLRTLITSSSTTALYGPANPFAKNASLEDSFWTFMLSLNMLLLKTYPQIIAREGFNARLRVAKAFATYFADEASIPQASSYAKMRYNLARNHDVDDLNKGRLESGALIGLLVNTVPSMFYMLLHVYKSPALLSEVRQELETNAVTHDPASGKSAFSVSKVRANAPLLNSIYRETLRIHSENASARYIMEDTTLDNRWLLKKGSILLMPNCILHQDEQTWGNTAFEPKRFMKLDEESTSSGKAEMATKRATTAAYRPFGGGSTLCPGRHFAANEVLGLAAMMLLRYDMESAEGDLVVPESLQRSVVEAIIPPKHDVNVRLRPRKGAEGDWDFTL